MRSLGSALLDSLCFAVIVAGAFSLLMPLFGVQRYDPLAWTFGVVAIALFIYDNVSRPSVLPYRNLVAWFSKLPEGTASRLARALFYALTIALAGTGGLALLEPVFLLLFGEEAQSYGEAARLFGIMTAGFFVYEIIWPTKLAAER